MEAWHILIVLGIASFIAEIFTAGFISASIGIGFLLAALGNYIGLEIKWQIMMFSAGIALSFFLIRPLTQKFAYRNKDFQSNRDAIIGKTGAVSQEIDPKTGAGRVSIDGDDWKAISKGVGTVKIGTIVKVVDIDSIVLIVEPQK